MCRQRPLPVGPLAGESDVQSAGACPLSLRLQGAGQARAGRGGAWGVVLLMSQSKGSQAGGLPLPPPPPPPPWAVGPADRVRLLAVGGLISAGAPASNVPPRWGCCRRHCGTSDKWTALAERQPGGDPSSGVTCPGGRARFLHPVQVALDRRRLVARLRLRQNGWSRGSQGPRKHRLARVCAHTRTCTCTHTHRHNAPGCVKRRDASAGICLPPPPSKTTHVRRSGSYQKYGLILSIPTIASLLFNVFFF